MQVIRIENFKFLEKLISVDSTTKDKTIEEVKNVTNKREKKVEPKFIKVIGSSRCVLFFYMVVGSNPVVGLIF